MSLPVELERSGYISMENYTVLMHCDSYAKAASYLEELKAGARAGERVKNSLSGRDVFHMEAKEFLERLLQTKLPQIFAESAVRGDGSDWNLDELSILGDISIAVPVTIYDDGRHSAPAVHRNPWGGTLLFTPGALLQNGRGHAPADWAEVTRDGTIDREGFYRLYERRLLPVLSHADTIAREKQTTAFMTIPGLGCGQFAGKFRGQLGHELKEVLIRLLTEHGDKFSSLRAIYYDPYNECGNERYELHGISLLVRPLTQGNWEKPQLCRPEAYEEPGDSFGNCEFFSVVAWDHVSWPGNDFYGGSRATDDGVKAAATDAIAVMTGIEGAYDPDSRQYKPPAGYSDWNKVVSKNTIQLKLKDRLLVFSKE